MSEFRFELKGKKYLEISIAGDVRIMPGADEEILAVSQGTVTVDEQSKERIALICNNDCEIQVPSTIKLEKLSAGGDAMLSNLKGDLKVESVGGDLLLKDMASAEILRVGGDLEISSLAGDLSVDDVGGDLLAADLQGSTRIGHIGGDITLSKVQGLLELERISGDLMLNDAQSIHARKIKGDADLYHVQGDISLKASGDINLQPAAEGMKSITLEAGGDIDLYWPSALGANFALNSDGGEIEIELGGREEELETDHVEFTHGDGKVKVEVHANGDVLITSRLQKAPRVDVTGAAACFDEPKDWGDAFSEKFHENWAKFEHEFDRFPERWEKSFGEQMDHVGDRIEEAMQKVRQGIKMDKSGKRAVVIATALAGKQAQNTEERPAARESAVTEDERKMILKMLQEKKISVEEAEKLFETLEGREDQS